MGRRGYPPEFRRRVIDLLDAGRAFSFGYDTNGRVMAGGRIDLVES